MGLIQESIYRASASGPYIKSGSVTSATTWSDVGIFSSMKVAAGLIFFFLFLGTHSQAVVSKSRCCLPIKVIDKAIKITHSKTECGKCNTSCQVSLGPK